MLKVFQLSSNILVVIFRVNIVWAFYDALYRAGSRLPSITYSIPKTSYNAQTIHIHPEDGSCSVRRRLDNFQHSMRLIPESRSCTFYGIVIFFLPSGQEYFSRWTQRPRKNPSMTIILNLIAYFLYFNNIC
jgi:hypothetical protein